MKGPGINLATSEVFETSDLTEADQHYFAHEETSDSIEPIHVSVSEAFGRFKGSCLDNKDVDFSDKIRNSRRKGYIVWKGQEGEKEEESALKKYQRLNCEVRELLDEISGAQKSKDPTIQTGTLETLSQQADILHKHLLELRLEDVLGKEVLDSMTDPQTAARERLMSQLSEVKSLQSLDASRDKANTKGTGELNYSLMLKPDSAKLQASSRLARLSARIAGLEKVIGNNSEDLSILSMETGKKNITEAVSVLSGKTTILEPKNLDHIEGRLAVLQQKLGEEDVAAEPEDTADLEKVRELTKVSNKAGVILAEVPDLIDRMEALNPLHTQAGEVSESLVELEAVQKQLLVQLSNNSTLLREIQNKFKSNMVSIDNNFKNLHARIQVLHTKK